MNMSHTLIRIFIVTISVMGCVSLVLAQQPTISPEKKALIAEMISVSNADRQVENIMRAMFDEIDRGYPNMVDQLIAKRYPNISDNEKKEIKGILLKRNTGDQSFRERMMKAIDFHDYVESSVYPLYDKFFTESELADLLTFYKSPTGRKVMEVTPQLMGESVRLAQEFLVPKIIAVSDQTVENDIAKACES
jgi:hypothetical protein